MRGPNVESKYKQPPHLNILYYDSFLIPTSKSHRNIFRTK